MCTLLVAVVTCGEADRSYGANVRLFPLFVGTFAFLGSVLFQWGQLHPRKLGPVWAAESESELNFDLRDHLDKLDDFLSIFRRRIRRRPLLCGLGRAQECL